MYRISQPDSDHIVDADTLDQLEEGIRAAKPGYYHVDQIELDPMPSGHTSRRWGRATKREDGSVELEADSWEE